MRCSGGDKNDSVLLTKDTTNALQFTKLIASSVDGTAVAFGTIANTDFGTNITDSNSPINITNTGNAALNTINVTGANMTAAGSSDIDIGQFLADDTTSANTGQVLTTSSQTITGVAVPTEDETPGDVTDSLFAFFAVPATLESGSYTATWTLTESE